MKYNNFGLPGKGNHAIENSLNTFSINDAHLVIQFTDMYRIQYLENDNLQYRKVHELSPTFSNSVLYSDENLLYNFTLLRRLYLALRENFRR